MTSHHVFFSYRNPSSEFCGCATMCCGTVWMDNGYASISKYMSLSNGYHMETDESTSKSTAPIYH